MRYTNWDLVLARYPSAAKMSHIEATQIEQAVIAGAEAEVDARLAHRYAVPFTTTPTLAPHIVQDVATDIAYYRASLMGLPPERATLLRESIDARLNALATGSMAVVGSGGVMVPLISNAPVWGTHMTKTNITGTDPIEDWGVSQDELDAESSRRD